MVDVILPNFSAINTHKSHYVQDSDNLKLKRHCEKTVSTTDKTTVMPSCEDMYIYKTHAEDVCFPHSSISGPDQCNFHMTASWHLQLYKHSFDVLIQTQRHSFASTWSVLLEFLLLFLLLAAEAKLYFSVFIHLLYPLSFVPCNVI